MNIKYCKDTFSELCRKYNHPVPPISANGRLTRTMGRVRYELTPMGKCVSAHVEFSTSFIVSSSEEDIRQVVMHEFAHYHLLLTDPKNSGHTPEFRAFCKEIGCTHTGSHNGSNTMFKNTGALKAVGYKYIIKCPRCGATLGRYKTKCKTVQQAKLYTSGCCRATCVVEEL